MTMNPHHRLGCRPLHESPGLLVHRAAQEIIGRGIADIELDSWIQGCEFHQVWRSKVSVFSGRLQRKGDLAQLIYRLQRLDAKYFAVFRPDRAALEDDIAYFHFRGNPVLVTRKDEVFMVI